MQILNPHGTATLLWWRGLSALRIWGAMLPLAFHGKLVVGEAPDEEGLRMPQWGETTGLPYTLAHWIEGFGSATWQSHYCCPCIYSSSHLNCLQLSVKQLGLRSAPPSLKSCSSGKERSCRSTRGVPVCWEGGGRVEWETVRWIGAATAMMQTLYQSLVVKGALVLTLNLRSDLHVWLWA